MISRFHVFYDFFYFFSVFRSRSLSASSSCSSSSIFFKCFSLSRRNLTRSSSSDSGRTPTTPRILVVRDGLAGVSGGTGLVSDAWESLPTYFILWIPSSLYAACRRTHAIPAVMAAGPMVRRPDVRPRSIPPVAAPLRPLSSRLCLRRPDQERLSGEALLFPSIIPLR